MFVITTTLIVRIVLLIRVVDLNIELDKQSQKEDPLLELTSNSCASELLPTEFSDYFTERVGRAEDRDSIEDKAIVDMDEIEATSEGVGTDNECEGREEQSEDTHTVVVDVPLPNVPVTSRDIDPVLAHNVATTRRQLLKDITSLDLSVMKFGSFIVYGPHALPILTSGPSRESVIMVACTVGKGRVVLLGGWSLGSEFESRKAKGQLAILHENIVEWVGENVRSAGKEIPIITVGAGEFPDLNPLAHVLYCGMDVVLKNSEPILSFLHNGGGVVVCTLPKRFLELNPGMDKQYPAFLSDCGVLLTSDVVFHPTKSIHVTLSDDENANHAANHAYSRLQAWLERPLAELRYRTNTLEDFLKKLPSEAVSHYSDKFAVIFQRACSVLEKFPPPSPKHPMKNITPEIVGALAVYHAMCVYGFGHPKVRGAHEFPGDVPANEALVCGGMKVLDRVAETHPTGYYAPPGVAVKVDIFGESGAQVSKGWTVQLGCHSDKLWSSKTLKRYPDIVIKSQYSGETLSVCTPYGGSIYVTGTGSQATVVVRLENVVESPFFDTRDPKTAHSWNERRVTSGSWADITGHHVIITVPSSSVRTLEADQLTAVIDKWDKVVRAEHDLRGTDPDQSRREWFVTDIQITNGFMHAGYPIMGHLSAGSEGNSKFLLNGDGFRSSGFKFWGPLHEIGHNMQRSSWTWNGLIEVTCNIFTFYAIEAVTGVTPMQSSKYSPDKGMKVLQQYLQDGAPIQKATLLVKLTFFMQIVHVFGWQTMKQIFRTYETTRASNIAKTSQGKIDKWCEISSHVTGYNMAAYHEFWGFDVAKDVQQMLKELKLVLPEDIFTALCPERVEMLKEKYPDLVRLSPVI